MGIYLEVLILYVLLFFSGSSVMTAYTPPAGFSYGAELARILTHNIPSLALIWYLLLRNKTIRTAKPESEERLPAEGINLLPGKNDLLSGLIALPCLLITGFTIAIISYYIIGGSEVSLYSPSTVYGWLILCISCITSAYLEESFFRFYLLSKREELKLSAAQALVFSVALFSICHIYEGPWGFLNSALSGALLSFIFLRYKSLHGIAIAHGLYNITVYIVNAMFT